MGNAAREDAYDYVIVGAGSAGCVLANRLTEDRQTTVLLLEAGGHDWSPYVRIPAGLKNVPARYDWRYRIEPDASRNNAADFVNAGRLIGGTSSINGLTWTRGHRANFDSWAAAGCEGWDYESVLPYFVMSETYDNGPAPRRGTDGPLHVARNAVTHITTEAFIAGACERNHELNVDYNGEHQEGVSYVQKNVRRGWRHSTARAYLAPARRRRNLVVGTNATVTKVVMADARAVGVEYMKDGRHQSAHARVEVIVSAGAIGSPKLLMLSGIGPASHLDAHGIDVLVDNPSVGANLQDHPVVSMTFAVTARTLNQELGPRFILRHGLNFLLFGRGPAAAGVSHAQVFGRVDPTAAATDFQAFFAPLGFASDDTEARHDIHNVNIVRTSTVMAFVCGVQPRARGTVTLRSPDPHDPPVIHQQLLGDQHDVATMIAACREIRSIFATTAMKHFVTDELAPSRDVQSDDEWEAYVRGSCFHGNHSAGTCRMGVGDDAVVDPSLRVLGVDCLRVIDASIMPTVTSGNTQAPVIMVAEKAAALIRGRRPRA